MRIKPRGKSRQIIFTSTHTRSLSPLYFLVKCRSSQGCSKQVLCPRVVWRLLRTTWGPWTQVLVVEAASCSRGMLWLCRAGDLTISQLSQGLSSYEELLTWLGCLWGHILLVGFPCCSQRFTSAWKSPHAVGGMLFTLLLVINHVRASQFLLEVWIFSFPCWLSVLWWEGSACACFGLSWLCFFSRSSNVTVSWQLLFSVLFELVQAWIVAEQCVTLTLSRRNKLGDHND